METRYFFPLGKADGKAFCNRTIETDELIHHIESGKHTFVVGPRRYGKTSLCEYTFIQSKLPWQGIDFHLAVNEKDIERLIIHAVIKLIGQSISHIDKLTATIKQFVKSLKPTFSLGPSTLHLELEAPHTSIPAENVKEALLLLDQLLLKKKLKAILLLDEFQEVGNIAQGRGIEGAIRSAAQETKALVMVFSGSNPTLLQTMFEDKRRPLYKLCRKLLLSRIEQSHYKKHLNKAAKLQWKASLDDAVFAEIMNLSEQHPHYVNYLCDVLWATNKKPPTIKSVRKAWEQVCEEERSDLIKDFLNLSDNQKRVMKYIANFGGDQLYSSIAAKQMDIPQGSVRGATQYLLDNDFIHKQANSFILINPIYKKVLSLSY